MTTRTYYHGNSQTRLQDGGARITLEFPTISKTASRRADGPAPQMAAITPYITALQAEFKAQGVALTTPPAIKTENTNGNIFLRDNEGRATTTRTKQDPHQSTTQVTFVTEANSFDRASAATQAVTHRLFAANLSRRHANAQNG